MKRNIIAKRLCVGIAAASAVGAPLAQAQLLVRIGDADGFGYGAAPSFKAASGGLANIGPGGDLYVGDFLPDINENGFTRAEFGTVSVGSGDDFDHRSAAEIANTSITVGVPVSNVASVGSKWTDISLSTTYGLSSAGAGVHVAGSPPANVFGAGGAFPDVDPAVQPNTPGFVFSFTIPKTDIIAGSPVFFNMVFGDYDVGASVITFKYFSAAADMLAPTILTPGTAEDGMIDGAFIALPFAKVFTDGGLDWTGWVDVDFTAATEPYLGFDWVELSSDALTIPESSTMAVTGLAALGMVAFAARRRMAVR